MTATAASSTAVIDGSSRQRSSDKLLGTAGFHQCVADRGVAFHQRHQRVPVDRDDLARRQAVGGRDAPRLVFDERRPAEHVAAADDVAGRRFALAQAERESHHAVGEHVEVIERVADRIDPRVLRERPHPSERSHSRELRFRQGGEETRFGENPRRVLFRPVDCARQARYFRFEPAIICLNLPSSSSFMNTVCSGPG
jgi:hypothetical protein